MSHQNANSPLSMRFMSRFAERQLFYNWHLNVERPLAEDDLKHFPEALLLNVTVIFTIVLLLRVFRFLVLLLPRVCPFFQANTKIRRESHCEGFLFWYSARRELQQQKTLFANSFCMVWLQWSCHGELKHKPPAPRCDSQPHNVTQEGDSPAWKAGHAREHAAFQLQLTFVKAISGGRMVDALMDHLPLSDCTETQ